MAFDRYAQKSYAQEGEDRIMWRYFEYRESGFYVDVGAHHPARFSNTYLFYRKGWRGINIDAMPGCMKSFQRYRPRDINLEQAVGEAPAALTYYRFNEPALNGFDARLSEARHQAGSTYKIVGKEVLTTRRLDSILDEFLPHGQSIDFMSIDVEGLDMEVLRSNDWTRYRPEIVLVEVLENQRTELATSETGHFLGSHGYAMFAKAVNTVMYRRIGA